MHVCNLSVKEAEARTLEFKAGVWGMREERKGVQWVKGLSHMSGPPEVTRVNVKGES